MLYPRDPSLDPQLVWKGKDEQDRQDLDVPVVPIYIQEKIHPQAIIETCGHSRSGRSRRARADPVRRLQRLDDFDKKIDFYQHDQHWSTGMILGDSLLVMTSLAEKEGLKGKVQTIYFDPPYGIKFGSNWQVSTRKRDVKDGKARGRHPPARADSSLPRHLGARHSLLSGLPARPARRCPRLLTESGSIFVQIGDENVHLVRCVMDEVFGSENFCQLRSSFAKTTAQTRRDACRRQHYDYLLWYAKDIAACEVPASSIKSKTDGASG